MNIVPDDFVAEQLKSVLSDMHVDVVSPISMVAKCFDSVELCSSVVWFVFVHYGSNLFTTFVCMDNVLMYVILFVSTY